MMQVPAGFGIAAMPSREPSRHRDGTYHDAVASVELSKEKKDDATRHSRRLEGMRARGRDDDAPLRRRAGISSRPGTTSPLARHIASRAR